MASVRDRRQNDSQLTRIGIAVARVEEGQKHLRREVGELKGATVDRLNNHADRVRSLERTRSWQRGAGWGLSGFVTFIVGAVAWWKGSAS